MLLSGVRVVFTLVAISRLDSIHGGRRLLLLRGVALTAIGQLLVSLAFYKGCSLTENAGSSHCWNHMDVLYVISSW